MEPYKKIANLLWETSSSNHASTAKLDIMPKNVNKLLVANRGEIALRVVRTAREMGIPTVAVYAEQDRHAQYVQMADDAYLLSGDTYKDTYLNEDLLIDILQRSGADAVHPGYGFLSEVASFAQKVLDAGATWVGPNPKALVDLGDKITARRVATFAKVPPVPGISQSISDMRLLLDFAHTHGYPLMLKRTDGGGGRGITLVHNDDELRGFYMNHDALQGGDLDEYFVERFIDKGRHVETQCGRDSHGNFTVYSTRDCSVQRRNQKLVEEAPAPFLSDGVLEQLETYSRRLFEAVDYIGLGTCEFMVTEQGKVYFLEVNPRLQVEHTVSEEVCGLDLVREQLTIANGSISAASMTTKVCRVIGTGVPGIGTAPAMEAAASSTANSVDFKTAPNLPLVAVLAADEMVRIALRMVESSLFCGCYRMLQKLTKMSLSSINAPHRRVAKFR